MAASEPTPRHFDTVLRRLSGTIGDFTARLARHEIAGLVVRLDEDTALPDGIARDVASRL